jgi:hypothetical protein
MISWLFCHIIQTNNYVFIQVADRDFLTDPIY